MTPLFAKATPNPDYLVPPPPVLSDPRAVFDRVLGVASLLRALDPSLPKYLRFYRRAEAAEDTRNNAEFKLVFTHQAGAVGMATEQDVAFWDAAERLLPAHALEAERERLNAAPSYRFANAMDAAVYGAHRDQVLQMNTKSSGDPDWVINSSNGIPVPEMDFISEPSLSRWLYLAPNSLADEDPRVAPALTRARANVKTLMSVLSKSYDDCSSIERSAARESFEALEGKRIRFETTHQHGWIGFAMAHGAKGWTKPLLQMGADPRVPYNGELPVVWACALDAAADLRDLEAAGASVSLILTQAPQVYDAESQARLEKRSGQFMSLISLAANVGASRAAATLAQLGANINHADSRGSTPLHIAATDGNENLCRVLVLHGADVSIEDGSKSLPCECVPQSSQSLFDWLEAVRLGRPLENPTEAASSSPAPTTPGVFEWTDIVSEEPVRLRRPKA